MSDTNNPGDKTLSVDRKTTTLSLRRPSLEQGTVRQSFSHGRTKAVVVEKKKRRILMPGEAGQPEGREEAVSPAAPQLTPQQRAVLEARAAEIRAAEAAAAAQPKPAPAEAEAPQPVVTEAPAPAPVEAAPPPVVEAPAPVVAEAPAPAVVAEPTPVVAEPAPAEPVVAPKAAAPAPQGPRHGAGAPSQNRSSGGPSQSQGRGGPGAPQRPGAPGPQGQRPGGRQDGRPGDRSGGQRADASPRARVVHRQLTQEEIGARAQALAEARLREADDRRRAEEEVVAERELIARIHREREEAERRRVEEEVRKKADEEVRRRAAEEAAKRRPAGESARPTAATPAATTTAGVAAPSARRPAVDEDEDEGKKRGLGATSKRPKAALAPAKPTPKGDDRRRSKLTIVKALEGDEGARARSLASMRRRVEKHKRALQTGVREKITREVILPESITIQELANRMAERAVDVIKLLMKQGQMHKITDVIDADTAELVAEELGHTVKRVSESDVEEGLFTDADDGGDLVSRPPVVTIMGHVDHGKTSLLDAIREANVVAGEAGGITQHIGAYQVDKNGQKITFIDTPGHEAFTAMRARGAKSTDIVVLVVAADDGVMPQTIEAINHARAAGVPIVVAVNKIDKPGANPDRVRNELLRHDIVVEALGGETQEVLVSATQRTNLDGLLEAILLQSEVLELKANPDRPAEGSVIEAKLDKGRGPVATVLVQRGTLRVGDILIAGTEWGRVRALVNDRGEQVKEAGPSTPVEVLGFQATPEAGDRFAVVESEARAREITDYRQRQKRDKARPGGRGSLAEMMSQLKEAGRKEFVLLVKGDVQGSVEAIIGALEKLGTSEVTARVIHSGVGAISESDVTLAATAGAAIIGFNVRANIQARDAAERDGIEIRYYNIIYDLVDDVKAAMSGLLAPERRETFLGNAEILEIFNVSKVGKVAGCRVTEGTVERGASVRLIRDGVVIHEGKLSQLKRFKDDAKEVVAGQDCGMAFESYQDMRAGDVIECFRVEEIARTL
ncbi:translation initiation factor IF-2 [Segnochrobactrum spirostomi]|uniref:Translation initiation factor IF-2 n=1 Tax=Segnochrobactrum spirostomi TaxID=2608987 RepID=A0A6A7Y3B3_9HYPH|nr:translation initiation factor IF-2 [Segnochrobactrum spirostomi]MQT12867.1 translation initiation factor IF-2 [Segnochrobactrum spirostomi]